MLLIARAHQLPVCEYANWHVDFTITQPKDHGMQPLIRHPYGMFNYSLKELLYWWTIWMISVSLVTAFATATFALVVVTLWLSGTVAVEKWAGYRLGFAYSVVFASLFSFLAFTPMNAQFNPMPPLRYGLSLLVSLLFGLFGGTIVWCIATGADKAFKRFTRSDGGTL